MLKIINPYPGFENGFYKPFTESESNLFFGRSQDISGIKLKLRQKKLVTLVSEPKTGVTSLLRAGLTQNLRTTRFDGLNGSSWRCVYMHPGEDPIINLAQAIVNPYNKLSDKLKPSMEEEVYNRLLKNDYGLLRVFENILADQQFNILLIIDDFHECFNKLVNSKTLNKFLNLLYKLYSDKSNPFYLLFSIKTETYRGNDIKMHPKLFKGISAGLYKIKFLNKDDLKKAIEMPAQFGQSTIDADLSKELVKELIQDTDQLRKLQLLMSRTWFEWKRKHSSKVVDKKHFFKATGQKAKAIAKGLSGASEINLSDKSHGDSSSMMELSKVDYSQLSDQEKSWFRVLMPQLLTNGKNGFQSKPMDLKHVQELLNVDMETLGDFATKIPTIIAMDERKMSVQNVDIFKEWTEVHEWMEQEIVLKSKFADIADAAILYYIEGIDIHSVISKAQYNEIFEWYDPNFLTPAWAMHQHENFELGLDFIEKLQEVYGPVRKKAKRNSSIKIGGGGSTKSKIKLGGKAKEKAVTPPVSEAREEVGEVSEDQAKQEAMEILGMAGVKPTKAKAKVSIMKKNAEEEKPQETTTKSGKLTIKPKVKIKDSTQTPAEEKQPLQEEPAKQTASSSSPKKKIVIKKK